MLREIASTCRKNNRKFKRWFTDANMELFVWFKDQTPVCFQLSYDKLSLERSISWHVEAGFTHSMVKPESRHAKQWISPNHSPDDDFDAAITARQFLVASDNIEAPLADFIFARLIEYPGQLAIHSNPAFVSAGLR